MKCSKQAYLGTITLTGVENDLTNLYTELAILIYSLEIIICIKYSSCVGNETSLVINTAGRATQ